MIIKKKIGLVAATLAAGALALSACGASNSGGSGASTGSDGASSTNDLASKYKTCDPSDGLKDASSASEGDKTITIGAFGGWDESTATAYLMKNLLQKQGYTANVKTLDAAPGFTATAKGDVDVLTDVWLPKTHKDYIDKYGSQMEAMGCWYDTAKLTIAVNDSSPAKSLSDLKSMGSDLDNTITGIEPGAGEMGVVKDEMMPAYGLDSWNLKTSSTAAMLASLQKAESNNTNIAVTLWKPHWAYAKFKIRDLKDPKGAMGGNEGIWNWGTKGFSTDHPKAAQMFKNLVVPDSDLSELEALMTQKYDGKDPEGAVAEWLKGHPEFSDQLVKGQLKSDS